MIFIIDFWLINLAFIIVRKAGWNNSLSVNEFNYYMIIFGLIWIIAGFFNKIYRIETSSLMKNITINLFGTFLIHLVIVGSILFFVPLEGLNFQFLVYVYSLAVLFIIGFRLMYKLVLKYFQFSGFDQRKVVIVGATGSGVALYDYFKEHASAGYHVEGFFDDVVAPPTELKAKLIGTLNPTAIKSFCTQKGIGEIYFSLSPAHNALLKDLSQYADNNFMYFRVAPDFGAARQARGNVFLINSIPILTTRKEPLGISLNANLKRGFDILFSALVILLLFPLILPVIAIAIRLDSKGPIFFKQLRPGRKNKLFDCYKFRTMQVNGSGERQATKNDSRITRVGRILRKTNLDELPQFFNVLLGNMSVVGPRPNMISQLEEYSKSIQNYGVRHFVTPGITGYAQVNGFRGETKEIGLMQKRVEYDVNYIENWSIALDMKIIFLTVYNMMRGEKNAY